MKPPAALRFSVALCHYSTPVPPPLLKITGILIYSWICYWCRGSKQSADNSDVTTGLRGCRSGLEAGRSPFKSVTGSDWEEPTANDSKKEKKKNERFQIYPQLVSLKLRRVVELQMKVSVELPQSRRLLSRCIQWQRANMFHQEHVILRSKVKPSVVRESLLARKHQLLLRGDTTGLKSTCYRSDGWTLLSSDHSLNLI